MYALERYEEYKDTDLDIIVMKIKNGTIKCGKYSNLVKIKKLEENFKKQKEFFNK